MSTSSQFLAKANALRAFLFTLLFALGSSLAISQNQNEDVVTKSDGSIEAGSAVGAAFLILLGGIFTFYGRRLRNFVLFFTGFVLGSSLTLSIINEANPSMEPWVKAVVACVIGLFCGIICVWLYKVGLAVVGALLGILIVRFIQCTKSGGLITNQAGLIALYVIMTILGAILIFWLEKHILILSTGLNGSWAVFTGIDYFALTGFRFATEALVESGQTYELNSKVGGMIAGFIILAIIGIVFQYRQISK